MPIALDVLRRLRDEAPNFVGLKVSDAPWEAFEPYLSLGLDVFVGPEIAHPPGHRRRRDRRGLRPRLGIPRAGCRGRREPERSRRSGALATLRAAVERFPRQAAMKRILAAQGVPVAPDVRAPLRDLTAAEAHELDAWLATVSSL